MGADEPAGRRRPILITILAAAVVVAVNPIPPSLAQGDAETGAQRYGVGRPVPPDRMRPLSADRPDATESPYTVDAGHWQVEASFVEYARDDEGADLESWSLLASNVKLGITESVDLQLVFAVYGEEEVDPPGPGTLEADGFSDVTVRAKVNLWGNDGGATAFGIMPFVKLPTGGELSNDEVEGGLIASLAWAAGEGFGLGFMLEADAVYDGAEDDHDAEILHTVVAGFDLAGPYGAYVEYVGVEPTESGSRYRASLSGGATYGLSDDAQLDAGLRVGLNDAAEDLVLFTGITVRF